MVSGAADNRFGSRVRRLGRGKADDGEEKDNDDEAKTAAINTNNIVARKRRQYC